MPGSVKVGYGISFTRYFYRPQPLRPPKEIWADIRALEQEAEGLLEEIRGGAAWSTFKTSNLGYTPCCRVPNSVLVPTVAMFFSIHRYGWS